MVSSKMYIDMTSTTPTRILYRFDDLIRYIKDNRGVNFAARIEKDLRSRNVVLC